MSQEKRRSAESLDRGLERGDVDARQELHDPEVIVRWVEGWPEPGPSEGREAVMAQFTRLRDAWGDTRLVEEALATHREWVVVRWRLVTEGGGSGVSQIARSRALTALGTGRSPRSASRG